MENVRTAAVHAPEQEKSYYEESCNGKDGRPLTSKSR
jgi:hypothetical protein